MDDMTRFDDARENARQSNGRFGAQHNSAPEAELAAHGPVGEWGAQFLRADVQVGALIPLVERRFRDLVRETTPGAEKVTLGLSYDTDGDALVYISVIDGEEVDDDNEYHEALSALQAYGYNHERLGHMSAKLDEFDHFTFDLTAIEGEGPTEDEFASQVETAWTEWEKTAALVGPILDETGHRLGLTELTFMFTDTDDDRRVTLHGPDGSEIEEPSLLAAMNSYVSARRDMNLFPGVEQTEHDEWEFTYRVAE